MLFLDSLIGKQFISRASIRKNATTEYHPERLTSVMSPMMSPILKEENEKEKSQLKKTIIAFEESKPDLEDFPKIKEENLHLKQYAKIKNQEIDLLSKNPLDLEKNAQTIFSFDAEKDNLQEWDFENLSLDFNLEDFLITHIKIQFDKDREEFLIKERLKCIRQTIINNSEETINIINYHMEGTKSLFSLIKNLIFFMNYLF